MSVPSPALQRSWAPAPGVQVEALLTYPFRAGSVHHRCWKVGTVTTTGVLNGKQCAQVRFTVVGDRSITYVCIYEDLRPPAPQCSYISSKNSPSKLLLGDAVEVFFMEAWCPAAFLTSCGAHSPKVLLYGDLRILSGTEVQRLRRIMSWDTQSGWVLCQVPSNVQKLLTVHGGNMKPVPRAVWLGLHKLTSADMRDSRFTAASCQPPRPTVLPSHVPPNIDDTTLPIWKVKGAVWKDSGCWALTYIPAVAAKINDVVNTATGRCQQLNFTPQQWQAVVEHLGLLDSLVAQINGIADAVVASAHKRTHAQAAELVAGAGAGSAQDDIPTQAFKRASLGGSSSRNGLQTVHGSAGGSTAVAGTGSTSNVPSADLAAAAAASTAAAAATAVLASVDAPRQLLAGGLSAVQQPTLLAPAGGMSAVAAAAAAVSTAVGPPQQVLAGGRSTAQQPYSSQTLLAPSGGMSAAAAAAAAAVSTAVVPPQQVPAEGRSTAQQPYSSQTLLAPIGGMSAAAAAAVSTAVVPQQQASSGPASGVRLPHISQSTPLLDPAAAAAAARQQALHGADGDLAAAAAAAAAVAAAFMSAVHVHALQVNVGPTALAAAGKAGGSLGTPAGLLQAAPGAAVSAVSQAAATPFSSPFSCSLHVAFLPPIQHVAACNGPPGAPSNEGPHTALQMPNTVLGLPTGGTCGASHAAGQQHRAVAAGLQPWVVSAAAAASGSTAPPAAAIPPQPRQCSLVYQPAGAGGVLLPLSTAAATVPLQLTAGADGTQSAPLDDSTAGAAAAIVATQQVPAGAASAVHTPHSSQVAPLLDPAAGAAAGVVQQSLADTDGGTAAALADLSALAVSDRAQRAGRSASHSPFDPPGALGGVIPAAPGGVLGAAPQNSAAAAAPSSSMLPCSTLLSYPPAAQPVASSIGGSSQMALLSPTEHLAAHGAPPGSSSSEEYHIALQKPGTSRLRSTQQDVFASGTQESHAAAQQGGVAAAGPQLWALTAAPAASDSAAPPPADVVLPMSAATPAAAAAGAASLLATVAADGTQLTLQYLSTAAAGAGTALLQSQHVPTGARSTVPSSSHSAPLLHPAVAPGLQQALVDAEGLVAAAASMSALRVDRLQADGAIAGPAAHRGGLGLHTAPGGLLPGAFSDVLSAGVKDSAAAAAAAAAPSSQPLLCSKQLPSRLEPLSQPTQPHTSATYSAALAGGHGGHLSMNSAAGAAGAFSQGTSMLAAPQPPILYAHSVPRETSAKGGPSTAFQEPGHVLSNCAQQGLPLRAADESHEASQRGGSAAAGQQPVAAPAPAAAAAAAGGSSMRSAAAARSYPAQRSACNPDAAVRAQLLAVTAATATAATAAAGTVPLQPTTDAAAVGTPPASQHDTLPVQCAVKQPLAAAAASSRQAHCSISLPCPADCTQASPGPAVLPLHLHTAGSGMSAGAKSQLQGASQQGGAASFSPALPATSAVNGLQQPAATPAAATASQQPAADAAVAGTPAAFQYSTLAAGIELNIELQKLDVNLYEQRVVHKQVAGNARVQVQKLLGHGGEADAYLCHTLSYELTAGVQPPGSRQPPQHVVVKLVHPPSEPLEGETEQHNFISQSKVFMWQEYDVLSQLSGCSSIVSTYGFGMAAAGDGFYGLGLQMPCILLEWAELGDLWKQLQPSPGQAVPMSARDTQVVMLDLVGALMALHNKGYIHRDVKPQNVLVCKDRSMLPLHKLSDFGLVVSALREVPDDGDGTAAYRPPRSEEYWFRSSDTYSLGRLFLACRSGATPPLGASYEHLRASGAYDNLPDPLRDVEWELVQVCLRDVGRRPFPGSLSAHTTYFDDVF